jgi:hypothetical protein
MRDPVIIVAPLPIGGWSVQLQDHQARHVFLDRFGALEYAHVWAQDARPSRVRVLDASGELEDECTYGHYRAHRAPTPILSLATVS